MADMTGVLTLTKSDGIRVPNIIEWRAVDLDFGATANATLLTVATHNILKIPAGWAFAGGHAYVKTTFTSASNTGTLQFAIGAQVKSGVYTADNAELVAGDAFDLFNTDYDSTGGTLGYVSADDTLDLIVGTTAITAGRIALFVKLIYVDQWV